MKLDHVNLTVTDVRAAESFLETSFGLRSQVGFFVESEAVDDDVHRRCGRPASTCPPRRGITPMDSTSTCRAGSPSSSAPDVVLAAVQPAR